jgi:Leucine-rich repeat (LRR) protein
LRYLDLSRVSSDALTIKALHHLNGLKLYGNAARELHVEDLPALTVLTIEMPNLITLNIRNCESLRHLRIDCAGRDEPIEVHLTALPVLQTFSVLGGNVRTRVSIQGTPNIEWISLWRCTTAWRDIFGTLRNSKVVAIGEPGDLDDEAFQALDASQLVSLEVGGADLRGHMIESVARIQTLRRLDLRNNQLEKTAYAQLARCASLEVIVLGANADLRRGNPGLLGSLSTLRELGAPSPEDAEIARQAEKALSHVKLTWQ